ncbi:SARP family transcriptional regulator [Actinorhabdospora filicis]|uniref:SARP family transcriptional regulator n=1 Tax=Actinorhabdospora filicis TaxID=1785913 RepID=A0A9W6SRC7_9ACTN|nr:BTAD domain-containing putative transcriptional regulator [Actinorhabdospora filicis]GLZ80802.1 SARP family transcriptional regulator [Actinorhabdospora filicis]
MIELRVLGSPEVAVDDDVRPIKGARTRALYAALVLNAGKVLPAADLIATVWGADAPKTAANQLQIAVHRLRGVLTEAGLDGALITREPGYILLPPEGTVIDLAVFRELASRARARAAAGDWTGARDEGRRALARWRGPVADGVDADRLRRIADTMSGEHLDVVELVHAAETLTGDHTATVAELKRLALTAPHRPRLTYLLVLGLALRGRAAEALETYQAVRGTAGRELTALERDILRDDLEPSRATLRSWYAAEPATPGGGPHRLPEDLRDFVGRGDERDRVRRVLADNVTDPHPATITVTGLGGVGKTTLAVRAATENAKLFPDGILYVDLRGADDEPRSSHDVLGELLHTLGVHGETVPDDHDARLGLYRSVLTGLTLLIVLDNASGEAQVRDLLPIHPASAAIVTSRRLLALDGAHTLELDVLAREDAVRLAQGVDRRIDRPTAERLVDLSGGHPLALRILASRTGRRGVTDEEVFDELIEGDLWRVFEASYRDLPPRPARLLRLAGLLPHAPFGPELAAALLDTTVADAERVLDELVDAQLLRIVELGRGFRYTLHDLVRRYGRRLAEDDDAHERHAALRRAYRTLLALAWHADDALGYRYHPTPPLPPWAPTVDDAEVRDAPAEWFADDHDLLVRAVVHAIDIGETETAWRLAACLVNVFDLHAHLPEAIALFERVATVHHDAAVTMRLALSRAYGALGRHTEQLRAAGWVRRTATDPLLTAAAAVQIAYAARMLGRPTAATLAYDWAHARLGGLDAADVRGRAQLGWLLRERALTAYVQGDAEVAHAHFSRALAEITAVGDVPGQGRVLGGLAASRNLAGFHSGAVAPAENAVSLLAAVGDRVEIGACRVVLAEAYLGSGRMEDATAQIGTALTEIRALRRPLHTVYALRGLGRILLAAGRVDEAVAALREALQLSREKAYSTFAAWIEADLASVPPGE